MPDLLGVTNPVPGYDSTANNRSIPISPNDLNIQNIPDPSRVGRPDARTDQQDSGAQTQDAVPRYDSNFQTFLQRLRQAPDLTAVLSRVFSGRAGTIVSSGMGEGIAAELSQFLEMIRMDQGQLLRFFTEQFSTGTRFGGPLFSVLREAAFQADSSNMKNDILLFLKRYSDFSSTSHIEGNLSRNLNFLIRSIPASWAGKLIELVAQFQNGVEAGDRAGNLKLLQGQILPYMSEYVERSHDMGRARSLLTHLALDVSRYENGSEGGLLQAFHQLKNYLPLRDKLGGLDDRALLRLLRSTDFAKAAENNHFANNLSAAADRALRGAGGSDAQAAFRELITAFLVNESVYMTVNHFVIPLEWDGKMMFSELWVDPDAEEARGGHEGQQGRTIRFLFKLDIQSLGFFDMILTYQDKAVNVQIRCPERVIPFSQVIERSLSRILADHDLRPESVQVQQMERPLTISEVFPKLFEGRDSVNVKV